jgi:hypothetical protein
MSQAYEERLVCTTREAGANLSTKQYYGVKIDSSDGQVVLCDAAGENAYGVLQDKPSAAGRPCEVAVSGICRAIAGGVINPGATVKVNASGKFVDASEAVTDTQAGSATDALIGSYVIGIHRGTAATADGDIFPLELRFMGAVPTTAA